MNTTGITSSVTVIYHSADRVVTKSKLQVLLTTDKADFMVQGQLLTTSV